MPRLIDYDASRESLFNPGGATDFFSYRPYASRAALCAELSRLVYVGKAGEFHPDPIQRFLDRADLHLLGLADNKGAQGFVVASDEFVVMAFRGTEGSDPRDVWADLNFRPRTWRLDGKPAGRVHGGFAKALDDIWATLRAHLPRDDRPVLVTGHSLGAAMATLAATRLRPAGLYTFGEPRVGNATFVRTLDRLTREGLVYERHVNCCDMVTRVPPRILGFRHTGTQCYVNRNGVIRQDPDDDVIDRDRKAASDWYRHALAWRQSTLPIRDLADHAPINYVSAALRRRKKPGPARASGPTL